jgi:tight adherence protein C
VAVVELLEGRRRRRRVGVRAVALQGVRRLGRTAALSPPGDLPTRLAAAGAPMAPAEAMAVKAGLGMVAALAALLLFGPAGLLLGAAGFVAPDLWLATRARHRAAAMESELADVLDLLRVAIAAGLSPWRAMGEVGRRHPGLLARELARAAARVQLGVAGEDALDGLLRRAPARGVQALVSALRRAQRHGAPLGPTLGAQALEARSLQARQCTERAARAAPKIQLVVALALVPAVLLLLAAALVPALLT